jgi:hypothetical protein
MNIKSNISGKIYNVSTLLNEFLVKSEQRVLIKLAKEESENDE